MVESQPSKLLVAGSSPVSRSTLFSELPYEFVSGLYQALLFSDEVRINLIQISSLFFADVAQSVEHILGKDEVTGSIPVVSSAL